MTKKKRNNITKQYKNTIIQDQNQLGATSTR